VEDGYTQGNDIKAKRCNGMLMWDKYRRVLIPSALQSECSGRASRARKLGSCPETRMIEFGLFSDQVGSEVQRRIYSQILNSN
jgi:hypothetical protein